MVEIQPGDVVRLRSGGPRMTVEKMDVAAGAVICCFFVKKQLLRETFHPAVIEIVERAAEE